MKNVIYHFQCKRVVVMFHRIVQDYLYMKITLLVIFLCNTLKRYIWTIHIIPHFLIFMSLHIIKRFLMIWHNFNGMLIIGFETKQYETRNIFFFRSVHYLHFYIGLKNVYLQKIFVYCNCRDEQMHNKNMLWFINHDDVWNFGSEIQACKQWEIAPLTI